MRTNLHSNTYKQNMGDWQIRIGALLLLSTTTLSASPGLRGLGTGCTDNFTHNDNYCYQYFEKHKAFQPAQQHCRSYSAYLVTIYSQEEQQFLHNLSGGVAHWIGLNDAEGPEKHHVEGMFKWDNDFEPIRYENWQEGEPNNKNHLDCVASDKMGWFMAVSGCATAKLPYICKTTATACPEQKNSSITNNIIIVIIIIAVILVCVVQCYGTDVIK